MRLPTVAASVLSIMIAGGRAAASICGDVPRRLLSFDAGPFFGVRLHDHLRIGVNGAFNAFGFSDAIKGSFKIVTHASAGLDTTIFF